MSPRTAAALRDGDAHRTLREHLVASAERLIARGETAGLTVRAVAREAGVADGVLYNHFANKEELLALALDAYVRSVESGLGAVPEPGTGTVEVNLRTLVARGFAAHVVILPAFAGLLSQPKVLAAFARLADAEGAPAMRATVADYLRAEQRLGRVSASADVAAVAVMISGAWHDVVLPRLFRGEPTPEDAAAEQVPDGLVESLVATVLHGIGARPD